MLKQRIIPKFLIQDNRLIKGVRFHEKIREAGNPVSTAKVYNSYGADELIFLDTQASIESRSAVIEIIEKAAEEIFMPLTVGGGIRTLEDIKLLLRSGADKVSINTAAVENPEIIANSSKMFGAQCIVVSIDYKEIRPGDFRVFTYGGTKATTLDPLQWAVEMERHGCGEILLCSIDRDGTMRGYDLDMIQRASDKLEIPVIASSGAGSLDDCLKAMKAGASAITVSSMFIYTDHSPIKVRSYLASNGINVRASKSSRN